MKKLLLLASVFAAGAVSAQSIVSTSVEDRNVILEEYTGKTCGWCPAGHKIAADFAKDNQGDVVLINIHTGSFASGTPNYRMEFPDSTDYGQAIVRHPDVRVTGYPSGTVNRRKFGGSQTAALSRNAWVSSSNTILGETSPVNVAVESMYDPINSRVFIKVEAYYTSDANASSNYLNVGILQNNIWGPQSGSSRYPENVDNSRPSWSATDPNSGKYKHMHMLRDVLTGQWGEELTETSFGSFHVKTYVWDVPEDINDIAVDPLELEAYAFVTESQMNIESGSVATVRAARGEIDMTMALTQNTFNLVGVDDVEEADEVTKVYPNPATENVFVKVNDRNISDVSINVYTATGQKVAASSKEQLNENTVKLDVSNFIDGFYFVEVVDGASVLSRETIIKR